MRQYLDIPEHGIRASYPLPLTKEIMDRKNGPEELNRLIKYTLKQHQITTWSGIKRGMIMCQLPWMKEAIEVELAQVSKIPKPVKENGPTLEGWDLSHLKYNFAEEKNKPFYDSMLDFSIFGTCVRPEKMMTATKFKRRTEEAHRNINPLFGGPTEKMLDEGRNAIDNLANRTLNMLKEHEFSKEWADKRNTLDMIDRDRCAPGMLQHSDRKLEVRVKEQRQRATEHLRKQEESRTLHAALAFDNTTGFTGMAHVDTLRGQM